jgi:mannose-6-phosphate isomerase-like protein (cupin superfamily)
VLSCCTTTSYFNHLRIYGMRPTQLLAPLPVLLGYLLLAQACSGHERSSERAAKSSGSPPSGLILRESEGERRMRRPRPSRPGALGAFIIKVDEKNGGSTDFFMGYEDIPPGAGIPPHHHPFSGEILFIQRGTGLALLGSCNGPVGRGSTIYIPRHTRVSLRNTGSDTLTVAFIFPGEGIGQYLRAISVLEGDSAVPLSAQEFAAIRARYHDEITFDSAAGQKDGGLILQAADGERRTQRPPPSGMGGLATPFIIKVDRKNGGSPDLVMLARDIETGQGIAAHHHPFGGEILFVHRGSGVASLGSREAPVTAGATIFIPPNTRASLRNTGTEPLGTVAIFAQPGFEEYLRDVSVPEGTRAPPLTAEELSAIRARHREQVTFDKP